MKVKELIEELSKADPDIDVILQVDSEGNGYTWCRGVDPDAIYIEYESCPSAELSAEDMCMDEEEWDDLKRTKPKVVVLFP